MKITQKGFDYYYFIDCDQGANDALKEKIIDFKPQGSKMKFHAGDANEQIKKLAKALKENKKYKALVLLDPFGMQVDWNSLQLLKDTGVDLWILVPTGVIINRLLGRNGELMYIEKLVSFFGMEEADIRKHFYKTTTEQDLFGENTIVRKVSQPIKRIAELYVERLRTIFEEVTEKPFEMKNSQNMPIFHFVFASNNKTAKKIAHKSLEESSCENHENRMD